MKDNRYRRWTLVMMRALLLLLVACLLSPTTALAAEKHKYTLVIDAGHGGKDAGAKGKYSYEKNINLNVALAFGRYVEKNCPDVRVIYTRKTDVFIPLHQRADIANKNKADVFVSIHTNAVASKTARPTGLETYTMGLRRSGEKLSAAMRENEVVLIEKDYREHYAGFDPRQPESYIIFEVMNEANMAESVELAQLIQKKVCATAARPNKGVKQDVFLVLRETSMPACLVELGYVTTASEEAYLNNSKNVDLIGKGLYQAFAEYRKAHDKTAAPAKQEQPAAKQQEKKEETKPAEAPRQEVVKQEAPQPKETAEQPGKAETQPEQTETKPQKTDSDAPAADGEGDAAPVFKVQFLSTGKRLKAGDQAFKGLTDVDSYQDGSLWKYTVGASTNYEEIAALRRQVAKTFPEAFVVAFRQGQRIDINEARSEYFKNKKQQSKK